MDISEGDQDLKYCDDCDESYSVRKRIRVVFVLDKIDDLLHCEWNRYLEDTNDQISQNRLKILSLLISQESPEQTIF